MNEIMKNVTEELTNCASRIELLIETVNSNIDLDSCSVARHGMGLVLQDIEGKLTAIRDRLAAV